MRIPRFLMVAFAAITMIGCDLNSDSGFRDQFRWISGKWKGQVADTVMVEQWKWNRHRFEGVGYEIWGDDTIFSQEIFLEPHGGFSSYVAVIPGQLPVMFSGHHRGNSWIFINAEHDFPSRVVYVPEGDSLITVSIVDREDTLSGWSYSLRRVK